jgi:amino acid transporter
MPQSDGDNRRNLRPNALGVSGIVFFVIATVAPMGASISALPLALGIGNGAGTAGAFVVVGVVLLLFSVGYSAMASRVSSAGGFYVFIREGMGNRAGRAAGLVALVSYNAVQVAIWGTFGYFGNEMIKEFFGVDVPWQVLVFGGIAAVAYLGWRDIDLSAKVLGLLMIAEVIAILALDAAVLISGGEDGITAEPFTPSTVLDGSPGIAFMIAIACFLGFEATAIYAEEARTPEKTIPRAAYISVLVMAGFYTLTSWCLVLAYGQDKAGPAAAKDPAGFVFGATTEYLGGTAVDIMKVLFLTSTFATVLGFHNALGRYMYSLGRDGWMPGALGEVHEKHRSPHRAGAVQTVIAVVTVSVFALFGLDPYADMFTWLIAVGTLGLIALMTAASIAVVCYFRREASRQWWRTLVAPSLAALSLAVTVVLLIDNWDLQTGGAGGVVPYLPWLLVFVAVAGLLLPPVRAAVRPGGGEAYRSGEPTLERSGS